MTIGFRVLKAARKVSSEWAERYRHVPVANVSDSMNRMTAGGARLRPMHREGVLAGPALTVKARPGDNLMLHYAIDIAQPGDVIVVDAGGDLTNALIGEMMVAYAVKRGVAGIVIHGAIRDAASIGAGDFPLFAAGVSHRGPYKDGPGEINVPIAIDGMVIEPGDLVIGDDDGLLCVPYDQVPEVFDRATAKHAAETKQLEQIAKGENDRSWVLKSLQQKGCALPD
ncbi:MULTISPECIES: RraA family protein [unclassified Pseudomonas]|uniref:RraA family protein n=1 Tax=unclassified Pseudomonas TaxID=196821 RepID=UPI000BD69E44|nr:MULTISPECIES: RraA family protein [unclassified Pseudomonas]PVZ20526.1 RraA family protein [Pseudomonas sp. URIL14HWK12:I12]PVZ27592.1 RraA family protein [Pseudomonas sp. URIL14HWK12:I10]PVZ38481.1 RraA family protein [Pseudomonas sp. URIL14HWK12:I11]SNZ03185.1 RraA famliy [Pseudomonas sp. URIL14HWK12:I9]